MPPKQPPDDRDIAREPEPASSAAPATAEPAQPGGVPYVARGTRDLEQQARLARHLRDDLSAIAHDLKNPLGVILLEVNALEQRLGHAAPAVHHGLERIAQNTQFVERLVSGLLDLVSSDDGMLELRLERVDLARLLHATAQRAVPSGERHRVEVDVRFTPILNADPTRLERVVANLIDNALKHSPRGTPVTVRLDQRGDQACVSVIDAGSGLDAAELDGCFERYHRGAHVRQGHGLGLYICRKIIEAHRGRIGVQSAAGKGARFYFLLPH
jgi:signal transduction histidine kinase